MLSIPVPNSTPAVASSVPRRTWLRRAWQRLMLDDDDRFLHDAHDLADLEARLRRLERGRACRFGPMRPLP